MTVVMLLSLLTAHLALGLVGLLYWYRKADRLNPQCAAFAVLTGPLIYPIGALAWGDTGVSLRTMMRERGPWTKPVVGLHGIIAVAAALSIFMMNALAYHWPTRGWPAAAVILPLWSVAVYLIGRAVRRLLRTWDTE